MMRVEDLTEQELAAQELAIESIHLEAEKAEKERGFIYGSLIIDTIATALFFLILLVLVAGCGVLTIVPPTKPVDCESHVWGDKDGDGAGYYLRNRNVWVNNTSQYALE